MLGSDNVKNTISCLCEKSSKCDFSTMKIMGYNVSMLEAAMKFYKFNVVLKHDFIQKCWVKHKYNTSPAAWKHFSSDTSSK